MIQTDVIYIHILNFQDIESLQSRKIREMESLFQIQSVKEKYLSDLEKVNFYSFLKSQFLVASKYSLPPRFRFGSDIVFFELLQFCLKRFISHLTVIAGEKK